MKKLLLMVVGLAVIVTVVTLVIFRRRTEFTPPAVTLLPATTVAFVDIPDFQRCRARVAASPLARFWHDPAVQACLAKPVGAWNGLIPGDQSPAWLTKLLGGDALALPQGEAFVAITHVTIMPDQSPQFTFAAGLNLRGHKLATEASLKLFEFELRKLNPAAKIESKKLWGRNYTLWQLAADTQVAHAFFGSLLVFTTDEALLREMIARAAGKAGAATPALAANAGYQTILRQLPVQRDLHAYLNVEQLVSRFGLLLLVAAPNNPLVQQLANIQAWGTGSTFGATNITDVGVTTYVKPNPAPPPRRQATLAVAPPDSTFYLAGTPNLANAYNNLLDLVKLSGNRTAATLVTGFELTLAIAGVDLTHDLLGQLGPEVAGIGNWRRGAPTPDFAIVTEVRDGAVFARKLNHLTTLLDRVFKTPDALPFTGATVQVIHISAGVSPAYALTGKFFVFALTADYARELVAQIQTGKVFLAGRSGPADTYCDLRPTLAGLYGLAGTNAVPLLGQLPAPATIARYVGTYTATTVDTPASSTTTAHSPLGKPVTMLIAVIGGLATAQTWLPQVQSAMSARSTMSSGMAGHPRPTGNQTAPFQIQLWQ